MVVGGRNCLQSQKVLHLVGGCKIMALCRLIENCNLQKTNPPTNSLKILTTD